VAQVVCRRPVTVEARIRYRFSPRRIYAGHSGAEKTDFSQSSLVFRLNIIPKTLHDKRQKEPRKTIDETSKYVRPERVKWHKSLIATWRWYYSTDNQHPYADPSVRAGIRRRSAVAWLLRSRVRIPFGTWMFVCCVYMLCCPVQVEVSATGWSLVQRSPTVCLCMCVNKNPKGALCSSLETKGKMNYEVMNTHPY
jgi:hypothetical protein